MRLLIGPGVGVAQPSLNSSTETCLFIGSRAKPVLMRGRETHLLIGGTGTPLLIGLGVGAAQLLLIGITGTSSLTGSRETVVMIGSTGILLLIGSTERSLLMWPGWGSPAPVSNLCFGSRWLFRMLLGKLRRMTAQKLRPKSLRTQLLRLLALPQAGWRMLWESPST